jgi:hypothetical protein
MSMESVAAATLTAVLQGVDTIKWLHGQELIGWFAVTHVGNFQGLNECCCFNRQLMV